MKNEKRFTKRKLSKMYGVSYNTLMKWMNNIPDLNLPKYASLTPKQVKTIIEFLGEP